MAEAAKSSTSSSGTQTPDQQEEIPASSKDMMMQETDRVQAKEAALSTHEGATSLENKIDTLLQKQRNELMFELRRLQHGDRPVTGQGNKEAVEQFFHRAIHGERDNETSEANRPESVVVEVNALVERRPVSSVLRSTGFRRSLENALRGALSAIPSARSNRIVRQRAQSPAQTLRPESPAQVSISNNSQQPPRDNSTVNEAVNVEASARIPPPPPPFVNPLPPVVPEQATVNVVPPPQHQRVVGVDHAESWVNQHQQHVNASQQNPREDIWNPIEDAHREAFIEDVSELIQRQLVTGTLAGNFRNVLESRMMERVNTIGANGQRVQQFVQSIPRNNPHVRNDFSDLGIVGPAQQQAADHLSDEMSVISAAAAVTVPYAQTNAALSRELNSLKAQMKEMMNMMKVQFDLTMDVQRSIRQEVAAAVHSPQGAVASEVRPIHSKPVNETTCLICTEKLVDTVLYQCGHMCVCQCCGINLRQRGANCPVCRAPIRDIIRAYKCNSE